MPETRTGNGCAGGAKRVLDLDPSTRHHSTGHWKILRQVMGMGSIVLLTEALVKAFAAL